jgi:transcriptional regulator with XRE-family HTH domain
LKGAFDVYKEIFPSRLKKARENTGFTQRQIESELKIKQSTLACYETGRNEPDIETLGILAEFYGVSVDWLFGIGAKANYEFDGVPRVKNNFVTGVAGAMVNVRQNF